MPLDISSLRAKLNELKGNSTKADILWKPSEGVNSIRIVPLFNSPDNPFTELYFHYLGNKTYLSPLSFNEPDPIAEFSDQLIAEGGLSKEEYREAKKFAPQRRTFVPIIDRNKPEQGVRFWAFGKTVYAELLNIMADPEYGDITDPQAGRDIKVTFTPQEKSDTGFAKTSILISPKQTALTKDADQLKTWLTEQPDLMSLHKRLSYDELKDVLTKYVNGPTAASPTTRPVVDTTSEDWGKDEETVSPTASASKTPSKKTVKDVEEEFEEMFKK